MNILWTRRDVFLGLQSAWKSVSCGRYISFRPVQFQAVFVDDNKRLFIHCLLKRCLKCLSQSTTIRTGKYFELRIMCTKTILVYLYVPKITGWNLHSPVPYRFSKVHTFQNCLHHKETLNVYNDTKSARVPNCQH